ncbi:hypothetical protein [Streptomyces sp. NPDC049040]|uniref:hypothetical protein n=1 Tax=Streptomyces sp. NPDC049040 TaxID=3365593 RepID=UPI003718E75D
MFTKKKIATVSLLLGGLSAVGVGIGHASAAGPSGNCTRDAQGNTTCVSTSEQTYVTKDGRYHVQQSQECTTSSREETDTPQSAVGQPGTTQIGASVGCSNTAPAPEGFVAPEISR